MCGGLTREHAEAIRCAHSSPARRKGRHPRLAQKGAVHSAAVRCPRVRDRVDEGYERVGFSSAILPPYARRSKSLEVLIPILYLKGVSTGDCRGGIGGVAGQRGRRPVGLDGRSPQGGLAG